MYRRGPKVYFVRRVVIAALRLPSDKRRVIVSHVWAQRQKLPLKQYAECLIEFGVHLRGTQDAELMKIMRDLVGLQPALEPLELRLNNLLKFLQAPSAASEELMTEVLDYLNTAVFWGPSEFEPLLHLAERADLAAGAAASLSQPLREAVESCAENFIVHACSLDEIGPIRELPIEFLRRVFSRLDIPIMMMIVKPQRVLLRDLVLFPLVCDFARNSSVGGHDRMVIVTHWWRAIHFMRGPVARDLQEQLEDMHRALLS
jgi:hypothetical protein